jgi:lysophospholipase L1-like esterase
VADLAIAQAQPAPYHNLAVPAATVYDMHNTVTNPANPFFTLINREALYGNTTKDAVVLDIDGSTPLPVTYETASLGWQATAKGPTLLTFWAGANDVLGWATRGGDQSPVPLTDPVDFSRRWFTSLQLLAGGLIETTGFPAAIITANLPDVTSAPYFLPEATFTALVTGQIGQAWPGGYEEADVNLVRFPTLTWILTANPADPIPGSYTLTDNEVTTANNAVAAYNGAIAAFSAAVNASGAATVAMVDMNTLMADIAAGTSAWGPYAGQHFVVLASNPGTADNALDTLFSLDGLHPNHRGYGVVANAFLETINTALGASVAMVDVDALVWDPTYAEYRPDPEPAAATPLVSARAARAMDALYR